MKLNKREVIDLLEREYIRGTSTLPILAESLGCTWQRLSQLGNEHFPNWQEHSRRRKVLKSKIFVLEEKDEHLYLPQSPGQRSP